MSRNVLRDKFYLEQKTKVPDEAGGWSDGWFTLGSHWCMVQNSEGKEVYKGSKRAQNVTHKFIVRHSPRTSTSRPRCLQRFRSGDRSFFIHAVFERDLIGRYLICLCEEASAL